MKKQFQYLGMCLLLCSSVGAAPPKKANPTVLKRLSKPLTGAALTAGFSYSLLWWYKDIQMVSKRYSGTTVLSTDNAPRLISDTFTALGLGYLTYKSGLFTLDSVKELLSSEESKETK